MQKPIITISREYGSGGKEIGSKIAHELGIEFFDRELISMAARESGLHISIHEKLDESLVNKSLLKLPGSTDIRTLDALFSYQEEAIVEAAKNPCVIVGRCADFVLRGRENLVRLYIYANRETRMRRLVMDYGIDAKDADVMLRKVDKERAAYYNYHTGYTWGDIRNYDLCINTSVIDLDTAAHLVGAYVNLRE